MLRLIDFLLYTEIALCAIEILYLPFSTSSYLVIIASYFELQGILSCECAL